MGILLVLVQGHFPRSVARRIKSENAQVTIALSQSREKRELRGKPGLRIICSITCARGRREGPVTAWAGGQFTGGAHLVTVTLS